MTQYQVVGECAHVTTVTQLGRAKTLLYKRAVLPADVPEAEIKHLLSIGAIAPFGVPVPAPVQTDVEQAAGGEGGSAPSDDPSGDGDPSDGEPGSDDETGDQGDDEPAEPGRKPAQSASKAAWVEWAVSQGADQDEASKASKADLVEAYGK